MWETDGDVGKVLAILPRDNVQNANVKCGFFHAPKPNTLATGILCCGATHAINTKKLFTI